MGKTKEGNMEKIGNIMDYTITKAGQRFPFEIHIVVEMDAPFDIADLTSQSAHDYCHKVISDTLKNSGVITIINLK